MSPVEPPLEIRYTGTQKDALKFLDDIAENRDGLYDRYQEDPLTVLEENGWEFSPREAFPNDPVPFSREDVRASLSGFAEEEERWWPWIWWCIPWIGIARPGGGGSEAA